MIRVKPSFRFWFWFCFISYQFTYLYIKLLSSCTEWLTIYIIFAISIALISPLDIFWKS